MAAGAKIFLSIRLSQMLHELKKKKKNLKSKILPINSNYPTDSYYKTGTVSQGKLFPRNMKLHPKLQKL